MSNPSTPAAGQQSAARGIRSGASIGDFEIDRQIGRGGMGTVYQARQRSLDRLVALKVLSDQATLTPSAVARFQREAQAAAKLHHPNIVPIFAQGEQDGVYYYAMELLGGRSADRVIADMRGDAHSADSALADTRPLAPQIRAGAPAALPSDSAAATALSPRRPRCPPAEFARIARALADIADALHYAHERGVVHRDVKPHNLIFANPGDSGRLCISDFGLARVLEQPGVTITGEFIGSPLYMAPEQITGQAAQVGPRSDIYSLGATLYEWITLCPPFPGTTRAQVISQIVQSEPAAPRTLDPQIPLDLETICLKSLEKNPERRYAGAAELARDLRRFADGQRIRARRLGFAGRSHRYLVRHPVATVSAAGLLLVAMLGVALVRARSLSSTTHREYQAQITKLQETQEQLESQKRDLKRQFAQAEILGEALKRDVPGVETLLAGRGDAADRDLARRLATMLQKTQVEFERARRLGMEQPDEESPDHLYLESMLSNERDVTLRWLNQCLEHDPSHFDARRLRAATFCALQQFAEMRADADELLRLDSQRHEGYFLRAIARFLLPGAGAADVPEVLADLDQAQRLVGTQPWVLSLRGLAEARSGDVSAALRDFDGALNVLPDLVVALIGRARARMALREVPNAVEDLSRVITLEPNSDIAYALRGECYDALERYDLSSRDYDQAMLRAPSPTLSFKYLVALSKLKQQEGDDPPLAPDASTPGGSTEPSHEVDSPAEDDNLETLRNWLWRKHDRDRRSMRSSASAGLGWYGAR
ncbi:MAG TPA: protein kinase [Phycisphaerae bacterium]|jgi:serine/threonine protein kinase